MSLHTCDGTFEGDRNCFVCGPGLEQQDKIDALQANTDASQRRVLELELENKRLRDALGRASEDLWAASLHDRSLEHSANQVDKALSTPPPALAEAYVRLRDAVETMVKGVSPDTVQAVGRALDEVAGLEKGE